MLLPPTIVLHHHGDKDHACLPACLPAPFPLAILSFSLLSGYVMVLSLYLQDLEGLEKLIFSLGLLDHWSRGVFPNISKYKSIMVITYLEMKMKLRKTLN